MSNRVLWLNPLTGNWTMSGTPNDTGEVGRSAAPPDMVYENDGFNGLVALSLTGTVTISYLWFGAVSSSRTYLRQRQSPVRTPQRIRPIDLRQRQTPRITG